MKGKAKPTKVEETPIPLDREIDAMRQVGEALRLLNNAERSRVMAWASARYKVEYDDGDYL